MTATEEQAIAEAAEQIGLSVAANLFPLFYLAQNVYDTIQSLTEVWNARESKDEMVKLEAGVDLIFAVIGWVPVVGAGVKKTFRVVNQRSEIYGPLLFDILRLVLQRAHIQTSPEQLIDKLFDAAGLKKLLTEAREHIEKSWLYLELPASGQSMVSDALVYGQENLPLWLAMFVERKLMHWRRKQPNSSADGTVSVKKQTEKPGQVKEEARDGANRAKSGASNGTINAKQVISALSNKVTGLIGEHIADYHCLEVLKWGHGWDSHDKGDIGSWAMEPGLETLGKLNDHTKLNKLFAPKAHGRGLDGVWRAMPSNNNGMKYALVEAKASRVLNDPADGENPDVSPKLGKATLIPDAADLLEPAERNASTAQPTTKKKKKSGGANNRAPSGKQSKPETRTLSTDSAHTSQKDETGHIRPFGDKIAQMGPDWLRQTLPKAVGLTWTREIRKTGYARHIFYTPFYSTSAASHAKAYIEDKEHDHPDHSVQHHYREAEVLKAVNEKQTRLNNSYARKLG